MERKIGEISEYNGEWYQCVESQDGSCKHCDMNFEGKCPIPIKECTESGRSDKSYVIFKKLKKVGEPYSIGTHIFQRYKVFIKPYIFNDPFFTVNTAIDDEFISIEIKQNEEVMEEIEWKTEKIEQYPRVKRPKISGQEELNLKPFSIEAAKAGKPVCTRDGRKARIICFDKQEGLPIVALVETKKNGRISEEIALFYINGRAISADIDSEHDLMMLPEKKEGWVNLWRHESGTVHPDGNVYSSKEEAVKIGSRDYNYVDTVKINWEE